MNNNHPKSAYKQVIVIRKDLNMRKGKLAAQVAHASMGALFARERAKVLHKDGINKVSFNLDNDELAWFLDLSVKIVVGVKTEDELLEIYQNAKNKNLPCVLIKDKGFTEFGGVETYTAVGIGPCDRKLVDEITGNLPLM